MNLLQAINAFNTFDRESVSPSLKLTTPSCMMAAGDERIVLEAPAPADAVAAPAVAGEDHGFEEEAPEDEAVADGQVAAAAPAVAVKTFRNHEAVLKNVYVYIVRRRYKDTIYWRCDQFNKGCRATAKSAVGSIDIIPSGVHLHDPEEAEVKVFPCGTMRPN